MLYCIEIIAQNKLTDDVSLLQTYVNARSETDCEKKMLSILIRIETTTCFRVYGKRRKEGVSSLLLGRLYTSHSNPSDLEASPKLHKSTINNVKFLEKAL